MNRKKNDAFGKTPGHRLAEAAQPDSGEIAETLGRLATTATLDDIMAAATRAVRTHLKAGGATFVLREGDTCYYAQEDAIAPLWRGKRFPMATCISGWCMCQHRPAVIPDIYRDPRIPHDAYRPTFVKSLAIVPVPLHAPVAAMGAYWAEVHDTSSRELGLLLTIGEAVAPAVLKLHNG